MTKNNFDNMEANKQQAKSSNERQYHNDETKSGRANLQTAQNNIVDVFEFEPVGFMSKGRW